MRKQRLRNSTYTPPRIAARERAYVLARQALSGDQEAWDTLYRHALEWVPGQVRRADLQHVFGPWDYQDITDEALSRCHAQLERYQGLSQFHWWVLGYAKNILRNRIERQHTHRRNQYLLNRAADERSLCQDPLWLLLRLERDQYLWQAFFQLETVDQTIVYHRVFFQTTYQALAHQSQLTRNQVRRHYEDALNAIRWNFPRGYRRELTPLLAPAPEEGILLSETAPESPPPYG